MQPPSASSSIIFETWPGLTPYKEGVERMENEVEKVLNGAPEKIIFCEHPPVFTTGTSAHPEEEILNAGGIPVTSTGRGGKTTYHGPGQRVIYPILNLNTRGKDLHLYIENLQRAIIQTLKTYGIQAEAHGGDEVGVWVEGAKIAAIGVRVRKWVTFHGVALNVNPNMKHFQRIIPCGLTGRKVTSCAALGQHISMEEMDKTLIKAFTNTFPPVHSRA